MSKFKVGDMVRVLDGRELRQPGDPGWVGSMTRLIGVECTVFDVGGFEPQGMEPRIRLKEGYAWLPEWLEHADAKPKSKAAAKPATPEVPKAQYTFEQKNSGGTVITTIKHIGAVAGGWDDRTWHFYAATNIMQCCGLGSLQNFSASQGFKIQNFNLIDVANLVKALHRSAGAPDYPEPGTRLYTLTQYQLQNPLHRFLVDVCGATEAFNVPNRMHGDSTLRVYQVDTRAAMHHFWDAPDGWKEFCRTDWVMKPYDKLDPEGLVKKHIQNLAKGN